MVSRAGAGRFNLGTGHSKGPYKGWEKDWYCRRQRIFGVDAVSCFVVSSSLADVDVDVDVDFDGVVKSRLIACSSLAKPVSEASWMEA